MSWARRASAARAGGHTQELAVLAANCTCLHLLGAPGCRTGTKGSFFAANFTSCHVFACICRYLHIKKFSRMNEEVPRTPTHKAGLALRCEPFARRTGILPVSNQETAFGSSIELETGETPVLRYPCRFRVVRANSRYFAIIRLVGGRASPSVRANSR